jgi:hypothetical protein
MDGKKIWLFAKPILVVAVGAYLAIWADRQIEKMRKEKKESTTT